MVFQCKLWKAVRNSLRSESPLAWLGKENYLNWHAPHLRETNGVAVPIDGLAKTTTLEIHGKASNSIPCEAV